MSEPKVGDIRTTTERYEAIPCAECGEPATKQITYLLEGTRANPASNAYGKDDCSWCSDNETHACDQHAQGMEWNPPAGYVLCATFSGSRFPHMVHRWVEVKGPGELERLTRGLERLAKGKAHGPRVTYWNIARRLLAGEDIESILAAPTREGKEYGPCPRRQEGGPFDPDKADRWVRTRWKGEGDWRLDWFPRSCSFCGCVHPDDAMRLLEEGWEVEVTRKIHKFYVHPPGTAERIEASIVGIRERGVDGMVETWSPVPPVKGYAAHFTEEQRKRINAAIARVDPNV